MASDPDAVGCYDRALAHLETQARRRAADVVEGGPGLLAVFDATWPVSHLSNRVLVTPALPEAYGPDDVLVFVDEVFAGRGLAHRKVDVHGDGNARLTPALQALGFSHAEVLVMTAQPVRLMPDDQAAPMAQAVDESVVRPLVEQGWFTEAADYTAETVRQLVERRDAMDRVGDITRLAVLDAGTGTAVAKADLVVFGGIAEIDDVLTLPEHRGRGYASALVRAALDRAVGCDFVYLQAAADDWPHELYGRLGFRSVGTVHEHTLLDAEVADPDGGDGS